MKTSYFAEVIESCLDHYIAQCWQWDNFPLFGALVQVEQDDYIALGLVTNIQTGSIDPTRTPFPYQKTEAELRTEQPQIFEFLKTTFTVHVVGYYEKNNPSSILYLMPPKPSKIHAFVQTAPETIQKYFFTNADFLHLLFAFQNNLPNLDELLLALIKHLATKEPLNHSFIEKICETFTLMTGNDYRRLKVFLKRVESLI